MTHVLIADDKEAMLIILRTMIESVFPGCTVSTANNGEKALQAYQQAGADLVISTYQMPVMTGPDLVRTLRASGDTIPIVIVSSDPEAEKTCYEAGATLWVEKLALLRELPRIVSQLLA